MKNMFDISGKKAIVTGGTRGLGYSMAEALVEAGCDVVIIGASERVNEAAAKLSCKGVRADLSKKEENYHKSKSGAHHRGRSRRRGKHRL